MAVKHVTIYECDVCKAHVDAKGLTPVKVGIKATEVCDKCLRKVEMALGLDCSELAELLEQHNRTR